MKLWIRLIVLLVTVSVCGSQAAFAEEYSRSEEPVVATPRSEEQPAATNEETSAGSSESASRGAGEEEISGDKMDQVLEMQRRILKELDNIKAELQIVKIRASQR